MLNLLPVSFVLALMPPLLLLLLHLPRRRGDLVPISVTLDLCPDFLHVLRRGGAVLAFQIAPEFLSRRGRVDAQIQVLPILRVVDLKTGLVRVADGNMPVPVSDTNEFLVRTVKIRRYSWNVLLLRVGSRVQIVHLDRVVQRSDRFHAP